MKTDKFSPSKMKAQLDKMLKIQKQLGDKAWDPIGPSTVRIMDASKHKGIRPNCKSDCCSRKPYMIIAYTHKNKCYQRITRFHAICKNHWIKLAEEFKPCSVNQTMNREFELYREWKN